MPYLARLGVSHLYLSPVLQARHGSTHGYDGVDPRRVSDELGGEEALRELCSAGLGVVLDIVPNHLAASEEENEFWRDPELRRRFFDLDPARRAPPVLRRRRPGRTADRGHRGLRDDARARARPRSRGARGRPPDRPSGRPRRPARLPGAPRRAPAPSESGSRRSWSPARSSATGRSRARPVTTSSTTRRRSSSTPPARRS